MMTKKYPHFVGLALSACLFTSTYALNMSSIGTPYIGGFANYTNNQYTSELTYNSDSGRSHASYSGILNSQGAKTMLSGGGLLIGIEHKINNNFSIGIDINYSVNNSKTKIPPTIIALTDPDQLQQTLQNTSNISFDIKAITTLTPNNDIFFQVGPSFGQFKQEFSVEDPDTTVGNSIKWENKFNKTGINFGFGLTHQFTKQFSALLEWSTVYYGKYTIPKKTKIDPDAPNDESNNISTGSLSPQMNALRFGLIYKF